MEHELHELHVDAAHVFDFLNWNYVHYAPWLQSLELQISEPEPCEPPDVEMDLMDLMDLVFDELCMHGMLRRGFAIGQFGHLASLVSLVAGHPVEVM